VKEFAKISPSKGAWEAAFERARSHLVAENIAKQAKAKPAVRKLRSNSLPDADWAGPGWKVFKPSSSEMRSSLPRQSGAAWLMSANLKPALRELAARSGRIVEFGDGAGDAQLPGGGSTALMGAGLTGLGVWHHKLLKNDPSRFFRHLPKATMGGGLLLAGMGAERLRKERQRNRVSELAARSGRIVEFGDGAADDAVIAALKAAASADESPAQRSMLLKQGLIEMVKGQVVITERGYDMMQKAGMPPKLTPEERREEIAGSGEKRLSRFNHGEHGEHRVEFAQGQYVAGLLGVKNPVRIHKTKRFFPTNGPVRDQIAQNARKIRGIDQVKGESLRKALQPKRDKLVKSTKDIYQKQKRGAVASMNSDSQDIQGFTGSQNYYSPLARKTKEVRAAYGLT
jgi:hypothetical protein